jgi:hypothetical protein
MNPSEHRNEWDQDQLVDMLVDGELSEPRRRELLRGLEHAPDGWRRCALAFLEAQCWRKELGGMAGEAQARREPPQPSTPLKRSWTRWPRVVALAASLLIAAGAGVLWRDVGSRWAPGGGQFAAGVTEPLPKDASRPARSELAGGGPQSAAPWEMVTLTSAGGGPPASPPLRLPAQPRDRIDDEWLRSLPAAIPPDVLRALENTGHEVRQSRQVLGLPLPDGRRLVVPLDQVEMEYRGRPAY